MLIYLIRHGETSWNRECRLQGREDIPLSHEGELQAERCARAVGHLPVTAVLTSPLSRAVETARRIAEVTCSPVILEPGLIERDFGSASGLVADIFEPEKYACDLEPLSQVADRVEMALSGYASAAYGDFAAVSHGGSINALLYKLSDGAVGSGRTRLKNACISVLEWKCGALEIVCYNREPESLVAPDTAAF